MLTTEEPGKIERKAPHFLGTVAELLSLDCRAHVGKETGKLSLRPVSEAWSSLRGMQNWGNVKGKQWKFLLGPENHSTEDMTSSAFS